MQSFAAGGSTQRFCFSWFHPGHGKSGVGVLAVDIVFVHCVLVGCADNLLELDRLPAVIAKTPQQRLNRKPYGLLGVSAQGGCQDAAHTSGRSPERVPSKPVCSLLLGNLGLANGIEGARRRTQEQETMLHVYDQAI